MAERQLYTNSEEVLVNLQRPIILNGIDEVASRGDLMERAIILHLPLIDETKRVPEEQFWNSFDAAFPGILGGLCSALSVALKNRDNVSQPKSRAWQIWQCG